MTLDESYRLSVRIGWEIGWDPYQLTDPRRTVSTKSVISSFWPLNLSLVPSPTGSNRTSYVFKSCINVRINTGILLYSPFDFTSLFNSVFRSILNPFPLQTLLLLLNEVSKISCIQMTSFAIKSSRLRYID